MYSVEAFTIAGAHQKACKLLIERGEYVLTEYNQPTWELPEPLAIKVQSSAAYHMRNECNNLSQEAMEEYIPMMCNAGNPHGFAYTYGDRMRSYPGIDDDYFEYKIDQILDITQALRKNPASRRAIAHTWIVEIDPESKTPPCMQTVQFILRNNKLALVAYFRSNDIEGAWGTNAFGLAYLQNGVATALGVDIDYLQTISACAHFYEVNTKSAQRIAYGNRYP